jgi:cysteine-S-conjugate beta-lyase
MILDIRAMAAPPSRKVVSFETKIVAHNPAKDDPYGATSMPIYQTATFAQPSATDFGAYDYTRSGNPTRDAAQKLHAM